MTSISMTASAKLKVQIKMQYVLLWEVMSNG